MSQDRYDVRYFIFLSSLTFQDTNILRVARSFNNIQRFEYTDSTFAQRRQRSSCLFHHTDIKSFSDWTTIRTPSSAFAQESSKQS